MRNTIAMMSFWREEITPEDLEWLPVRTGFIIMLRSNLLGAVWTYRKIGEWLGITTERVRQIEAAGIGRACWKRHKRGRYDPGKALRARGPQRSKWQ